MKKVVFLGAVALLMAACSSTDKKAELADLEKQRAQINKRIEILKNDLAENDCQALPMVQLASIKPEPFTHEIKVQGKVESDNNILVPARYSGLVTKVFVEEGERVQKGALLAQVDAALIERQIAEVVNSLELATTVFERQSRLWAKNIGSELEFLQAQNNMENLEKKRETLNEQLKLTQLIAPISGTVDQVLIKEGEATSVGFGAVRIVETGKLKIQANLAENYSQSVEQGDLVRVYLPMIKQHMDLRLDAVGQVIDPGSRTFSVELDLSGNPEKIQPNMLAVLTIQDYQQAEAVVVPARIIQTDGENDFLFIAKKDHGHWKVEKRLVNIGMSSGSQVEICSGLSFGEQVVVAGYQDLASGLQVDVQKTELQTAAAMANK